MKNFLAIALLCLTGCSQQSWWDRLASRQEQLLVIDIAEQLRAGNVDKLAQVSEPELKQQLPAYVTQVSPMLFKVNGKFSLQTVNVFELHGGPTTKTFVVQGGSEGSCPGAFSNRHCQQLTSLRFVTRAGLQGSLRGRRAGRRMLAFKVG